MALVIRYFSTTSAGAGDGTTWADRAALFSAGNWSSVITGFNYTSDALEARIGPGTYTCTQELAAGLITNDPTVATPLLLHGCDSSGNRLTPPDPNWVSAQPGWSDSGLPVIATTTNIQAINLLCTHLRLLKFTATARTSGGMMLSSNGIADWVIAESSSNGTSAGGIGYSAITNSVVKMTGAAYDYAIFAGQLDNCRVEGVAGTSGNRRGIGFGGFATNATRCTAIGFGGYAARSAVTTGNQSIRFLNCTFAGNAAGIVFNSAASQTSISFVSNCVIASNTGYGIDGQSGARVLVAGNRLRDNGSGDITAIGNYQTDIDNITADSDDATEFVDTSSGDYRVKYGSSIWGLGIGAGDGPATITG